MILFSAKKNRWKERFVEKLNPRYIYIYMYKGNYNEIVYIWWHMYSGVKSVHEVTKTVSFIHNLDEWHVLSKFQRHFLVVHGRGSWVRIWYICWVVSGTYNGLLFKYLHICLAPGLSISIKSDGAFTHASISGFKSESINIYNQKIKLEYLTTTCTFTHIYCLSYLLCTMSGMMSYSCRFIEQLLISSLILLETKWMN